PGRGDASADLADGRDVRPGAAEPERRAGARRDPVEVRLQERQVDRAHPSRRRRAEDRLEQGGALRVRLLLQRESDRRPPALEPGDGAPDRRVPAAPDPDVQRLRRSGRVPVRGDGSQEELLGVTAPTRVALKGLVWAVALVPLARLLYGYWTEDLSAN